MQEGASCSIMLPDRPTRSRPASEQPQLRLWNTHLRDMPPPHASHPGLGNNASKVRIQIWRNHCTGGDTMGQHSGYYSPGLHRHGRPAGRQAEPASRTRSGQASGPPFLDSSSMAKLQRSAHNKPPRNIENRISSVQKA